MAMRPRLGHRQDQELYTSMARLAMKITGYPLVLTYQEGMKNFEFTQVLRRWYLFVEVRAVCR